MANSRKVKPDYAPGGFGCHEALHAASMVVEIVDTHLCQHPALKKKAEWLKQARAARELLADLYQKIGAQHL